MEKFQLQAKTRDLKASPNSIRAQGLIPAEIYGNETENAHLAVSSADFEKLFRKAGESSIIELTTDNGKVHNVLIHDVSRHNVKNTTEHIDFLEVSMTEKLTATVPLEFVGESLAIKALGGTLVKVIDEIEVECLPADLPHSLTVDIESLATFDDQILVSNISLPARVEAITDAEEVVAKVQPPRDMEAELKTDEASFDVSQVEGVADKPEEVTAEGEEEKK